MLSLLRRVGVTLLSFSPFREPASGWKRSAPAVAAAGSALLFIALGVYLVYRTLQEREPARTPRSGDVLSERKEF